MPGFSGKTLSDFCPSAERGDPVSYTHLDVYKRQSEYHADLSAVGSALVIPLKDLELSYQTTSATALRITMAPRDAAAPVLVDLRRTSIYNGSTVATTTPVSSTPLGSGD